MVQTVLGMIPAKQLGSTLMHEHIVMLDLNMRFADPDYFDEERFMKMAIPQLKQVRELGIDTIIDATPYNLGRDVNLIRKCSQLSGIHMIASTGIYFFEDAWVFEPDKDFLVNMMLREINEGIQGTNIKAGIIKCATDSGNLTPSNRTMLEACAIVSGRTGVPIITHTISTDSCHKNGLEQQTFLAKAGVPLSQVVIGHAGDSNDLDYLIRIMKNGSYIGLDRFGLDQFNTTENRIDTLYQLIEKGWADHLVLSHDSALYGDSWFPWNIDHYQPQKSNYCLSLISRVVLPELRKRGVSEDIIKTMMQDNIVRLFTEAKKVD